LNRCGSGIENRSTARTKSFDRHFPPNIYRIPTTGIFNVIGKYIPIYPTPQTKPVKSPCRTPDDYQILRPGVDFDPAMEWLFFWKQHKKRETGILLSSGGVAE
jgi:hypothetical protein